MVIELRMRICSVSFISANPIIVISVNAQADNNKLEKYKLENGSGLENSRYRNRNGKPQLRLKDTYGTVRLHKKQEKQQGLNY